MRKLFTFLLGAAFLAFGNYGAINAQDTYKKYHVNESFDGLEALPNGWSLNTSNTNNAARAIYGGAGGVVVADGIVKVTGGGSGTRSADIIFTSTQESTSITGHTTWYVELDWTINKGALGNRNALGLVFLGKNSAYVNSEDPLQPAYADAIFGLYLTGSGANIHYWNMDLEGPEVAGSDPVTHMGGVFATGRYPGFRRASDTNVDELNASTNTNVAYVAGKTFHIKAELDFATHKVVSLSITDKEDETNTATVADKPFISNLVEGLSIISPLNTRSSNAGNGANADMDISLDNVQVYVEEASLGRADVVVNYLDQNGGIARAQRVAAQQEVSTEYKLLVSDKETFIENGVYYAYDADATGGESVIVEAAPAKNEINVRFKAAPATTGTYKWKGTVSEVWNELDENFTTDGSNSLGYQNLNAVDFSDAGAIIKEVVISQTLNLGDADMNIGAEDYTFSGAGKLVGAGALSINASTTIGIQNLLDGGLELNAGILTVKHVDVAKSIFVSGGTTLNMQPGGAFNKPITGMGGSITIIPAVYNYTSAITGVNEINYVLTSTGRASGYTYAGFAKLHNTFDGERINVNKSTELEGDTVYFGTTVNYPDTEIHLGDKIFMAYSDSPTTPTTINIGALSGSAESHLIGARIGTANRSLAYNIGTKNTNATFNGELVTWPISIEQDIISTINKVGTGKWTLTGNSAGYEGKVFVKEGVLELKDGAVLSMLSTKAELTVEAGATLEGAISGGTVGSDAYIYGTVTGTLSFGNNLSLTENSVTKIVVRGQNTDKLTVTNDLNLEGKLEIVQDMLPLAGEEFTIYEAANINPVYDEETWEPMANGFRSIEIPADYTFDWTTGKLTYTGTGGSGIDGESATGKVEESREYFDLAGKSVSKDYKGFVIAKIKYTDGSVSNVKLIKK